MCEIMATPFKREKDLGYGVRFISEHSLELIEIRTT